MRCADGRDSAAFNLLRFGGSGRGFLCVFWHNHPNTNSFSMKKLNLLLFLLLAFACSKQANYESQILQPDKTDLCPGSILHTFLVPGEGDSINIQLPTCFRLKILQGIDSSVGEFISSEVDLRIMYDIGILAGNYVNENSPNKQIFQSVNQEFWYEFIDGYMCFTFPNAGPANFLIEGNGYFDDALLIMKTVQAN